MKDFLRLLLRILALLTRFSFSQDVCRVHKLHSVGGLLS